MSTFNIDNLLGQFQQLQRQANEANERRYQEMLDTIGQTQDTIEDRFGHAHELLQDLGQSQAEQIDMGRRRQLAQSQQQLISQGLGGTSVGASMQRGIEADAGRAGRELTEQVGRQRAGMLQAQAGAEQQMGQFLAEMMERRHDQGPDAGLMTQLLMQLGQAQGMQQQPVFGGLSANARAGLDAFGRPMGDTPGFGSRATTGGGGGGGTGARVIGGAGGGTGGTQAVGGTRIGTAGTPTRQQARTITSSPDAADAGVAGTAFDDLFVGQDVFAGGNVLGEYTGGGTVGQERNLMDAFGQFDESRLPPSMGGTGPRDPRNLR